MKYKLIVSDLDDTILRSDYKYSERFVSAVKEYEAAGGKFIIATGRMTNIVRNICLKIGLEGALITYQGGMISDIASGKLLKFSSIPVAYAAEIGAYLDEREVFYQLYSTTTVRKEDGYEHIEAIIANGPSEYSEHYTKFSLAPFIDAGEPLSRYMIRKNIDPVKLMIMADPKLVQGYIEELNAKFSGELLINTSKDWLVEIISNKTSKGVAVDWVAKQMGMQKDEVICIGDSLNDVPMIKYAGLGVAVANGSQAAKAAADIIAPSNDEDGVAYIINKYGLNR
ncbi:MAG: Cof-type HAD-IIB family hydrolase [Clostridia bacterium]